ncbi:MAG: hypothetical protein GY869_22645, partial [Planctomycetes bacterium]|nr:hypothetical protein [Planctomycetota bacterium]
TVPELTVYGLTEPEAEVTVIFDNDLDDLVPGVEQGTVAADELGIFEVTGTLQPGVNFLYAIAVDAVANEDSIYFFNETVLDSIILSELIVDVLSTEPEIFSPDNGDIIDDFTTVVYDLSVDAWVRMIIYNSDNVAIDTVAADGGTDPVLRFAEMSPHSFVWDPDYALIAPYLIDNQGAFRLEVQALDANIYPEYSIPPVVDNGFVFVDLFPPTAPQFSDCPKTVNSEEVLLEGFGAPGEAEAQIYIFRDNDPNFADPGDGTPVIGPTGPFPQDNTTAEFSIQTTVLTGSNYFWAIVADQTGNLSDTSSVCYVFRTDFSFVGTTIFPPRFSPENADNFLDFTYITFSITDNAEVWMEVHPPGDPDSLVYRYPQVGAADSTEYLTEAESPHQFSWSGRDTTGAIVNPGSTGTYEITLFAYNPLDPTVTIQSIGLEVVVDNEAPDPPILADLPEVVSETPVTVVGTVEPLALVYIYRQSEAQGNIEILVTTIEADVLGNFEASIELEIGQNEIYARAYDYVGNGLSGDSNHVLTRLGTLNFVAVTVDPAGFSPNNDSFLDEAGVSFLISQDAYVRIDIADPATDDIVYSIEI